MIQQVLLQNQVLGKTYSPLKADDLIRLEAERNYTRFVRANGKSIITCRSLGKYDNMLSLQFVRVHKSYIVNRLHVVSIDAHTHSLLMTDGTAIPIARRKWTSILTLLASPLKK